jgi:hypothetical protein
VRAVYVGDPTVVMVREPGPGRVNIAIASASPLPTEGRPVVVAEFTAAEQHVSAGFVRAVAAVVDERQVVLPVE